MTPHRRTVTWASAFCSGGGLELTSTPSLPVPLRPGQYL